MSAQFRVARKAIETHFVNPEVDLISTTDTSTMLVGFFSRLSEEALNVALAHVQLDLMQAGMKITAMLKRGGLLTNEQAVALRIAPLADQPTEQITEKVLT
jgi:hypothetical protein